MPAKRKRPKINQAEAPTTSHEQDVRWVMSNLSATIPPDEDDAPSEAAWSMFSIASTDEKSKQSFLDKIYSKIINKEKPTEGGKQFADDKRKFFQLFSALETERPELINDNFPRREVETRVNPADATAPAVESASSGIEAGSATVLSGTDGGPAEDKISVGCAVG